MHACMQASICAQKCTQAVCASWTYGHTANDPASCKAHTPSQGQKNHGNERILHHEYTFKDQIIRLRGPYHAPLLSGMSSLAHEMLRTATSSTIPCKQPQAHPKAAAQQQTLNRPNSAHLHRAAAHFALHFLRLHPLQQSQPPNAAAALLVPARPV
eukprot:1158534-Pelagomonas_calceolata.AAC.5